ncbi:cytochrome c551 [Siminovitchia fortis]|uniref:Cytochrome c n=1 Tax=Siminovitchia fortis TaxID=254758 RepID=A0A443IZF7_9BACI|nr:cytochrome c [Siminovitchia fortis]RWR13571.1 cytochrome c [Siminovitchia fortis]WHY81973.1 cytochrome c [Siminovitchia fortis]
MKKKMWALIMSTGLAIGLAACGGGGNDNDNAGGGNEGGGATATNDAEAIFKQNCSSCHGENLEGRNGPNLQKIGGTLSQDEIHDVIENGRPGMPAGIIKGDDADKVAAWLAEKK